MSDEDTRGESGRIPDKYDRPDLPPGIRYGVGAIRTASECPPLDPVLLTLAIGSLRANGVQPGPTGHYIIGIGGAHYEVPEPVLPQSVVIDRIWVDEAQELGRAKPFGASIDPRLAAVLAEFCKPNLPRDKKRKIRYNVGETN